MSSILKALKRIEGQSPPPQSFPALPDSVDAKQAVSSKARKRWLVRRVVTAGLVLLVIVFIAVIVFQHRQVLTSKILPAGSPSAEQKKSKEPDEKSNLFKAKIPPAPVKKAFREPASTRSAGPQTTMVAPAAKSKKFSTGTRSAESGVDVGQQAPEETSAVASTPPPSDIAANMPARKQSSQLEFRPSKKSLAGKRTATGQPATVAERTRRAETYEKLNDSRIKLQALAWSSDAARRMAVINDRIVREGESLDGYQINQIRQEDVVVSDGTQTWSLEFGLKQ